MTRPEGKIHGVRVGSMDMDVGGRRVGEGMDVVPNGVGEGTWGVQAVNPISAMIRNSQVRGRNPAILKNPPKKF
ncbi:MAG: hypothetical protein ACPL4I_12730 [Bacteroidota bacterium]